MSLAGLIVDGIFTTSEQVAEEAELPVLTQALEDAHFVTGEAISLVEDHPVAAAAAFTLAFAAVVMAPEFLAVAATSLASTAVMQAGEVVIALAAESAGLGSIEASLVASQAIKVASTVVVEGYLGYTIDKTYDLLYESMKGVASALGLQVGSEGSANGPSFSIDRMPSSDSNSAWPSTTVNQGWTLQNLLDGTSQVTSYSGSGPLITSSYSGPDGSGLLTGKDIENADGTSQIANYGTDGSSTTITYTGPSGTGSPLTKDVENSDGTSQITNYGTDGSSTTTTYSGRNGSGSPTSTDVENADGTSQLTSFDGNGNSESVTYSGPHGTGSAVSVVAFIGQDTIELSAVDFGAARQGNSTVYKSVTVSTGQANNVDFAPARSGPFEYGSIFGPYYQGNFVNTDEYHGGRFNGVTSGTVYVKENLGADPGVYKEYVPLIVSEDSVTGTIEVPVSGSIYAIANPRLLNSALNAGIVHVGQQSSITMSFLNNNSGALTDNLSGGTLSYYPAGADVKNPFSVTASLKDVASGSTGNITLSIDTSQAGNFSGYPVFIMQSTDSMLPDYPIQNSQGMLAVQVNNYAMPQLAISSSAGEPDQEDSIYSLNLGLIRSTDDPATVQLSAVNAASGPADALSGDFVISGSNRFVNEDFNDVSGLGAGQKTTAGTITLAPGFGGIFAETIKFEPNGSNASGYFSKLSNLRFIVTGTVIDDGNPKFAIDGASYTISSPSQLPGVKELDIEDGGTLNIASPLKSSPTISFGKTGGTLVIGDPDSFGSDEDGIYSGPTIENFYAGDALDFKGIEFVPGQTTETYSEDTGVLKIANGPKIAYVSFGAGNTVVDDPFHITSDGNGGTLLTNDAAPCYCPGTLIASEKGKVAVENLAIGDRVLTVHGASQPIKWIGRRAYEGRFVGDNHLILPVTVKAGALAPNIPYRDLHLSPGHALYLDGVLVPAWRLVNGVSIIQATAVEEVAYLQVELHEHDVIWAEGTPAETFFDNGCRDQFQNAAEFHALYPEPQPTPRMCAPRIEQGFQLQAIQQRLAERAFIAPNHHPRGSLQGFVDVPGPDRVHGWAQDEANPEEPVCLDILLDGRRVIRVLANLYRADLRKAGLGSGCHAFEVPLPDGVCGCVEVRRSADGALIARTGAAEALATTLTA